MLNMDPDLRPSASEVLKHQWFEIAPEQEVDQIFKKGVFENLKNFSAEQKLKQAALFMMI